MTYPPSQDPWNDSANTEHPISVGALTTTRTRKRRTWTVIALAVALLVVAAGVGVVLAATRSHGPGDPEGQKACEIANNWNQSRPGYVDATIVDTVHSHSVHSTHLNLVDRGNSLFDIWSTVSMQQIAGDLTPAERDLRALAPLMAFRTACIEVGY